MARPKNALIVDDEDHARKYVRLILQDAGIATFWEASDGEEAMALFREHRPELVFLDVNLRMTSGLRLLEQFKASRPEVPVIMLSSDNSMKTVGESARLGAEAYILKHSPRALAKKTLDEVLDATEAADATGGAGAAQSGP